MRISDWSSDVCSSDLFQELAHLAQLDLVVAFIGDRAELDLLDLDLLGLLLGLVGLLLLVEPELAEVHDLADRRIGVGLDLDQVEPGLFGQLQGLRSEEHTSELQSLMRISYAVFCLKKKK